MSQCCCGMPLENGELIISLERLLLELGWDVPNLNSSCNKCLESMISDVRGELTAIQERSVEQIGILFQIVDPDTEQYQMVVRHFKESVKNEIVRIEKINNLQLQSEFETACGSESESESELRWLFHGSSNDNYVSIAKGGFDISRSKNGLLGKGVYFAENASYSTGYTNQIQEKSGTNIIGNILLCKVGFRPEDGHLNDIHCIQNDRRAYPQYIIYYRV